VTDVGRAAVIDDPIRGYRHLDPLPSDAELDEFYQSAYLDMIRSGQRFPESRRLLSIGDEADSERAWLRATLHADILDALGRYAPDGYRSVVDVGAGIGEFIASAAEEGWAVVGLEPSREAVDIAEANGRAVVCATLEQYLESDRPDGRPGAVVTTNVLEHVLDPSALLRTIRGMLAPDGLVVVRVPNDFNPLQAMAQAALGHDPWWIAAPDHVNYFDHASLRRVVEAAGFETVDQWGDFPMELFLLMGDDYIADRALGPTCHGRRQRLEMRMDPAARRAFGRSLVPLGWGRNSVLVARATSSA
jgi:SAM-dependent methyltransferase